MREMNSRIQRHSIFYIYRRIIIAVNTTPAMRNEGSHANEYAVSWGLSRRNWSNLVRCCRHLLEPPTNQHFGLYCFAPSYFLYCGKEKPEMSIVEQKKK